MWIVGGILKMKKTTKRARKVQEILYSRFKGNQATLYGTNMENIARQQYVTYQNQKGHVGLGTHRVGLVISVDNFSWQLVPMTRYTIPMQPNLWV